MGKEVVISSIVRDIIQVNTGVRMCEIQPSSILESLGDSLAGKEIILDIERYFNIHISDKQEMELDTVQDLINLVVELT